MSNLPIKAARPVVLCILDGWGSRDESRDNAIVLSHTPNYDLFTRTRPVAYLQTSGLAVGLPDGQMGNSEVGHTNLGAGRVVLQDLPRIDKSIAEDSLKEIKALKSAISRLKSTGGVCHLMGLMSPGGVHSHQDHIVALAGILSSAGIPVAVHGFLDGRDVPPSSAREFIKKFEQDTGHFANVKIATLTGRYYAMDRDRRWDRVEKACNALVDAVGQPANTALEAIDASYGANITDEFIKPAIIGTYQGMKDGDAILMANFRADRARQILSALADPRFDDYARRRSVGFCCRLGMSDYSAALGEFFDTLFPSAEITDTLGEIISRQGLSQLRIAETEKYAHVTFFFNGGSEEVYDGEDRILIPSPDVATYDLRPEMSASEVTDNLVKAIASGKYDLIIVNFANPDMVGHTGIMAAAKIAVETVDHCLERLNTALEKAGGVMLITADHGNIELMKNQNTGEPHTAHTTNLVPLILMNYALGTSNRDNSFLLENGTLADVAPTILNLMGLEQPRAMTGHSLLKTVPASNITLAGDLATA